MVTGSPYMAASALLRVDQKPYARGSLVLLWGRPTAAGQREPRYESPEFRRLLRNYQTRVLLTRKRPAANAAAAGRRSS